jgi:Ferredoxin-dependent bilin reductase
MTQNLFDRVIACADEINKRFVTIGALGKVQRTDILADKEYGSMRYRRAHISIVDARETKKLYLLHVTVFPHLNDPSPIFGFDIVCGPTKVSGAFHDFSISGDPTSFMYLWYKAKVAGLEWNKPRELPDWGKAIFSPAMIAIGAVGEEELDAFIKLGLENLDFYLANVGKDQQDVATYEMAQNRYCHYQKQNPRTPASLQHLGFTEQEAFDFVANNLFPEIH